MIDAILTMGLILGLVSAGAITLTLAGIATGRIKIEQTDSTPEAQPRSQEDVIVTREFASQGL